MKSKNGANRHGFRFVSQTLFAIAFPTDARRKRLNVERNHSMDTCLLFFCRRLNVNALSSLNNAYLESTPFERQNYLITYRRY